MWIYNFLINFFNNTQSRSNTSHVAIIAGDNFAK